MRISQKSEYALLAVLDLAAQDPCQFIRSASIAERHAIPLKFLEVILADLRHRGIVTSKRGSNGGYSLCRAPRSLSVGEVLDCMGQGRPKRHTTPLTPLWVDVDCAVWSILENTT